VQNTPGADILIDIEGPAERVQTGANPKFDSYSGFVDDGGNPSGLDRLLRRDGIKELIIYGLATDYCVKHTALDAVALGYRVELLVDLCRGISPETTDSALKELEARGIAIIRN
jgi:nicotinamidase/pyrazinamidase